MISTTVAPYTNDSRLVSLNA